MTAMELLAVALGLSIVVAALALAAGAGLEKWVRHPGVRERAWAAALYISALPPLLVALLLLAPPPAAKAVATPDPTTSVEASNLIQAVSDQPGVSLSLVAAGLVVLAALVAAGRAVSLARRCLQLRSLVRATAEPSAALVEAVQTSAFAVGVAPPDVRVSASPGTEAMVVGLRSPLLIVPEAMAARPADPATLVVCAHELAHLKRGDHRALWAEEVVLTLLAANPLLAVLRGRRAAAREEACDAMALAHAPAASRRRYARVLVDALKTSAAPSGLPALTFTSAKRTFAMLRLKAILEPATPARARDRWTVAGLGVVIAAASLAGSIAVASERQPGPAADVPPAPQPRPEVAAVDAPATTSRAAPAAVAPAVSIRPAPAPAPVPAAAPEARPSPETAGAPAVQAPVITNVAWARHPSPSFPSEASRNGVTAGSVTVSCMPRSDGRVSDCNVVREEPAGNGFGAATLAAMQTARLAPETLRGATPGSSLIVFTVRFRLAD